MAERSGDNSAVSRIAELEGALPREAVAAAASRANAFVPRSSNPAANGLVAQAVAAPVATVASMQLSPQASQIAQAQSLLGQLGYDAGTPDGQFGSMTRSAIISFQRDEGLPQSGTVTPVLIRQLSSGLTPLCLALRQRVRRCHQIRQIVGNDMRIDLRRGDIGMAEHHLYGSQVRPAL